MFKKGILILFLLYFGKVSWAQSTFEKVIDTLGGGTALCIRETFDGGFVYCGVSSQNGNDALIVKLDSTGIIEWAKVYSGPSVEAATYIEQTPDSGYIVNALYDGGNFYSKSWLLRLNAQGDTLWTRIYSAGNGRTAVGNNNSLANFNNIFYGLGGNYESISQNVEAFIITTQSDGTLLTSKTHSLSPFGTSAWAIATTYYGFILAGGVGITSGTSAINLIRTNPYGDTLWTKVYVLGQNDGAFDVKQTPDSGFVVTGVAYNGLKVDLFLLKTNPDGNLIWSKLYSSFNGNEGYSVQNCSDNGFIMAGRIVNGSPLNSDLYLIKTDSIGDTLWTREYGGNGAEIGYYVNQTKNGGYIIAGTNGSVGNGGAYIIKTDSLGLVSTSTGFAELNNPLQFTLYPNPTNGEFSIRLKGIANNASLEIYSGAGERLMQRTVCNNTIETVDLMGEAQGIYLCVLKTGKQVYYRKLILCN
jgi:hypothetical protein